MVRTAEEIILDEVQKLPRELYFRIYNGSNEWNETYQQFLGHIQADLDTFFGRLIHLKSRHSPFLVTVQPNLQVFRLLKSTFNDQFFSFPDSPQFIGNLKSLLISDYIKFLNSDELRTISKILRSWFP